MAIFRLSDESIARIHRGGLTYLESARLGRVGTPYYQYQPWTATPAAKKEDLFRGAHCVKNAPALLQQAQRLVDKEGAFFTTGPEHDLVLVPSLGLIIFSTTAELQAHEGDATPEELSKLKSQKECVTAAALERRGADFPCRATGRMIFWSE